MVYVARYIALLLGKHRGPANLFPRKIVIYVFMLLGSRS